jgi:sec-independent protein translocase protein TatA
MGSFSIGHWLIVFLIAALVFGPKRLAELGGGLGKGIRAFRDGASGGGGDEGGAGATPKGEISGGETKQG